METLSIQLIRTVMLSCIPTSLLVGLTGLHLLSERTRLVSRIKHLLMLCVSICIYTYLCLHFKSFTNLTHKVKQYDEGPHRFYKRRWLWDEQPEAPWLKEKLATRAQPLRNMRESEGDWPSKQATQSTESSGWILQSSISGKALESWQKEWSV